MPSPENFSFSNEILYHDKIATQAQVLVAKAVAGDREISPPQAQQFYEEHADTLVPSSVDRWAKSNRADVQQARQQTLQHIFAKDTAVAQRYSRGVETKGTIFQLSDFIKEGTMTVRRIDEELAKRTPR